MSGPEERSSPQHQWSVWALKGRRRGFSRWFTSAFLYSLSSLKIPKEPKRKYLTAVLFAAMPFLWCFSYTGGGRTSEPSSWLAVESNLSTTPPCFKLHLKLLVVVYSPLHFKNALKIAEFLRANKNGIRGKTQGDWGVGSIAYASGNVSVTTSEEKAKRSVSGALILLSICSRFCDTRSTGGYKTLQGPPTPPPLQPLQTRNKSTTLVFWLQERHTAWIINKRQTITIGCLSESCHLSVAGIKNSVELLFQQSNAPNSHKDEITSSLWILSKSRNLLCSVWCKAFSPVSSQVMMASCLIRKNKMLISTKISSG